MQYAQRLQAFPPSKLAHTKPPFHPQQAHGHGPQAPALLLRGPLLLRPLQHHRLPAGAPDLRLGKHGRKPRSFAGYACMPGPRFACVSIHACMCEGLLVHPTYGLANSAAGPGRLLGVCVRLDARTV